MLMQWNDLRKDLSVFSMFGWFCSMKKMPFFGGIARICPEKQNAMPAGAEARQV
jgi:hypothetical protein